MVKYTGLLTKQQVGDFIEDFSNVESATHSKVTVTYLAEYTDGKRCNVVIETTTDINDEFLDATLKDGLMSHWGYDKLFTKDN